MYRKSSGLFSRAEGCWTFDARDRTPRPSRATALHPVENKLRPRRALPSRASGFVLRRKAVVRHVVTDRGLATRTGRFAFSCLRFSAHALNGGRVCRVPFQLPPSGVPGLTLDKNTS